MSKVTLTHLLETLLANLDMIRDADDRLAFQIEDNALKLQGEVQQGVFDSLAEHPPEILPVDGRQVLIRVLNAFYLGHYSRNGESGWTASTGWRIRNVQGWRELPWLVGMERTHRGVVPQGYAKEGSWTC